MMSLQKNLRVVLVYLTLSVVGCFRELPVVGDASGKKYLPGMKATPQLENSNSVNPPSQIPIRDAFKRHLAAFRSSNRPSRVNLVPYSQSSDGNRKKTRLSYIEPRYPMDVIHDHSIKPKVNSGNYLELTGDHSNANNRYAFQGVQQKPNFVNFIRSLKSTSGINSASGIVKKEGLVNGMYVPKVYTSGEFSKSEMYSQRSQPFDFNVVKIQKNISLQPVIRPGHTKRISSDNMFRNVNHDIRQKNNLSVLNDNIPAATAAMSKARTFKKSHSDETQSVLPLKKTIFFSYLRDQIGPQDSNSNFSPNAKQQSSFESTNVSINAFKGFQHYSQTASQDAYLNRGRSQDPTVQDFYSHRKYDNLAEGASAIRSPAANIARSYKGFPSAETSNIQTIRQKLSIASNGKAIYSFPRIQLAKTPLVLSKPETTEVKTNIKLPATVPSALWMSSQHSTGRGKHLISSGRRTAQSLFIKTPMADEAMKISQSISQSVSGTRGTFKNSDLSSQNRPYYLTSKKPNTFEGFTFFPTEQAPERQTETYSGPKRPQSSISNGVQHALAHPRTALSVSKEEKYLTQAPNPLISNNLTNMHGKQSGQDPFNALRAHDRVSSTNTLKHHRVIGQVMKASLVYPSSTNTPENTGANNQAFYLQNNPRGGYNSAKESQFNERPLETSQRWTSGRLAPAQNTQAFTKNQTVLSLWKSSQDTTSERSANDGFARPNTNRNLFVKSTNVSSVSCTNNALNPCISTVAKGSTNANTFPEFLSVYHKTGLVQGADITRNIQLPTRHGSINDETVRLKPEIINSNKTLLSHFVPSIYRSTVANKVTGYRLSAGVQPQIRDVQKNIKANPTINRNAGELTQQLNTIESYNVMRLRATSSVVIGKRFEANREGENSEKNSIYPVPTSQSAIYRSASIHQVNSSAKPVYLPTIHSSVIKPYGNANIFKANVGLTLMKNETRISANRKASGMDTDLSAVGLPQTLRPMSSLVVGKFVKALAKAQTTENLNASPTTGLKNFKPVRFVDIADSASFSKVEPSFSAVFSKIALMSFQNISTSTPGMDKSITELPFAMTADSFTVISDLQESVENDLQNKVSISNHGFMPRAVTTDPKPSFTEGTAAPQIAVYSSELDTDMGNQTTQGLDTSQTVLGLWKSSQATTSERSANDGFARPNTYRNLFMKSNIVSSVSSSASNALKMYISTIATGTAIPNTLPEFPSVNRKTGLSQGANFTRNIQLPTSHGSINDETVSLKSEKFNSDKPLLSHIVPSIHRSTVANKVTGYPLNAGVQPLSNDLQKNIKANPTINRNAGELTQLNTNESYNVMRLRATSSFVIGRGVEANKEGKNSEKNSIYAVPTLQSAIYRSDKIHKANSSAKHVYLPTIHRSVIKPYGKAKIFNTNLGADLMKNKTRMSANRSASGMDIDPSAVELSQTLRPTSSFVVKKFVKALEKASTKENLNASKTNGLKNFKPVRFAEIAGSASFSNIKQSFSAVVSKMAHRSFQNISTSTPGMDESTTELPSAMTADSLTVISDLQENIENYLQSTVSLSNPGFVPTTVTADPKLSFTEGTAAPQTTVYSSELETDMGNRTTQGLDTSKTVLGIWKSSQATTSERSANDGFARPNTYRNLFMKSNIVRSVSSSASNALNITLSEFPSVNRKTGLSQGANFTRNIQLPTSHGSINNETVSLKSEKFNSDKTLLSHFVPSIHRSTVGNKVTGYPLNAGVQPLSNDLQKNIKANPTINRNAGELTQLNANESYNVMRLRATSSFVIGRGVEANKEGKNSEKNSIYAVPTLQSAIYRSDKIHKANSSAKHVYLPTIHRSVIKPYGKAKIFNTNLGADLMKNKTRMSANRSASGMDIDPSAVGLSQTLRPTSSFVVKKFVKALEKASTKENLNASQTNGLKNFEPVRFAEIAGSASFSNIKQSFSAVVSKMALRSFQNISTSTPGMDESTTELPSAMTADSLTVISDLQENIENYLQSTVSLSNPGFVPTTVTADPKLSFTEGTAAPQTTVYSSELETDMGNRTTQGLDTSKTVLGIWKSSQATTSERSANDGFARPNTYRNLFMKSNIVSSVSSSASNALNITLSEFPSVNRKTGLSQGANFTRNIQLPTSHGSINNETVSLKSEKFNSDKTLLSHFVPSIHRSTVANKVTGYPLNAGVQPESNNMQKNIKANPTINRSAGELTQLNTNESYNVMRLRATSSFVIGRGVEANKEGKNSENNSIYAVPTSQSAIYRSDKIHKANSSAKHVYLPTIHRSVIKPYGKAKIFNTNLGADLMKNKTRMSANRSASGMDIDPSAVGLSQTLRPTSSFVVKKFVKALEKASTKENLNASQTNGLKNFKPVRFAEIASSASFSNIKQSFSAVVSKMALRSFQNISTSTPGMDESTTELPSAIYADSFTVVSDLQENIEDYLQSTVSLSNPGFVPTTVTADPKLSFTEGTAAPQTTVYSSELETDPGSQTTPTAESIIPFYDGILIPNTNVHVTMTSD